MRDSLGGNAQFMDAQTLQACWQLGYVRSDQVPTIAATLLEAGSDSPALRVLAGFDAPTASELQPWLDRFFREASLPSITDDEARWRFAYDTARDIVARRVTPREGAGILRTLCTDLGMPEPLRYFVYLATDYGEGPKDPAAEAAWFDAAIIKTATELLAEEPASSSRPRTR